MGKAGKDELTLRAHPRATVLQGKPTLSICMRVESVGGRCRSISNNVWTLVLLYAVKRLQEGKALAIGIPGPNSRLLYMRLCIYEAESFFGVFFGPSFFLLPSFSFIFFSVICFFSFLFSHLLFYCFFFIFSLPF